MLRLIHCCENTCRASSPGVWASSARGAIGDRHFSASPLASLGLLAGNSSTFVRVALLSSLSCHPLPEDCAGLRGLTFPLTHIYCTTHGNRPCLLPRIHKVHLLATTHLLPNCDPLQNTVRQSAPPEDCCLFRLRSCSRGRKLTERGEHVLTPPGTRTPNPIAESQSPFHHHTAVLRVLLLFLLENSTSAPLCNEHDLSPSTTKRTASRIPVESCTTALSRLAKSNLRPQFRQPERTNNPSRG